MKKRILKYLIPSLTLAAGIAIAAAGFSMGARDAYLKQLNLTNIDSVIPTDGVASLNIEVAYADLEITASNDTAGIELSAENISRDYLKYSTDNNILNLKYSTNKWYEISSVPILAKKSSKIKITVPANISLQDIQIKSGIGKMSVNYLSAEKIYIDCGLGENNLCSLNADYIEVTGSAGDTYAENFITETFILSGKSGDAEILNFHTEKAQIIGGTGDIFLSGIIGGDSSIKCGMGDIKAEIFGSLEDYSIYIPKGEAEVNGKKFTGETEGKYNMDITAGLGDIKINFK